MTFEGGFFPLHERTRHLEKATRNHKEKTSKSKQPRENQQNQKNQRKTKTT